MRISGPIKVEFLSSKDRKYLFFADCHKKGTICQQGINLFNSLKRIKKPILILAEGSLDVKSIYTELDLVQFTNSLKDNLLPSHLKVEYTDIRRRGKKDLFWLDQAIIQAEPETYDELKDALRCDCYQSDLLLKSLEYFEKHHPEMIEEIEYRLKFLYEEDGLILLGVYLMDLYTLDLILHQDMDVLYYAGELHVDNLCCLLKHLDPSLTQTSYDSNFKNYCTKNNCLDEYHLDQGLKIPTSKCVNIPDIEFFFN